MKVIYKTSVLDKINSAVMTAYVNKREIERFVLNKEESVEFKNAVKDMLLAPIGDVKQLMFQGYIIEFRED